MSEKKQFFNDIVKAVRGRSSDQQSDDFLERISRINKFMDDAEKNSASRSNEFDNAMVSLRKDIEDLKKKMNRLPDSSIADLRKEMSGVSADVTSKINAINTRFDASGMGEIKNEIESLRKDARIAKKRMNDDDGTKDQILKAMERIDSISSQISKMQYGKDIDVLKKELMYAKKEANASIDTRFESIRKEMSGVSADVTSKINAINSRVDAAAGIGEIRNDIESLRKDVESANKNIPLANEYKEIIRKLQESVDSIDSRTCKMLTSKDIESLKKESEDARICANLILDKKIENLEKYLNGFSEEARNNYDFINSRIDTMPDNEAMDEIKIAVESLIKDVESAKTEKIIAANDWNDAMKKFQKSIDSVNSRLSGIMTAKDAEDFRKEIDLLKKDIADGKKGAASEKNAMRTDMQRIAEEMRKNDEAVSAKIDAMPKAEADLLRKDIDSLKRSASTAYDQKLKQLTDEMMAISKNVRDANSRIDGIARISNDMDGMRRSLDALKKEIDDARNGAHAQENRPPIMSKIMPDSIDSLRSKVDEGSIPSTCSKTQGKLMKKEKVDESSKKTDDLKKTHETGKMAVMPKKAPENEKHDQELERDNNRHKVETIMIAGPRTVTALGEPEEKLLPASETNKDSNDDILRLKKIYEQIERKVKSDKRAGKDMSHEETLLENASFELTVAEICLLEGDVEPCRTRIEKIGEMLEKVA